MMDAAATSLAVNGPLALAAIGAFLKLGPDSGFCSHSHRASELANKLLDRLSGELETVLAPLVETDIEIKSGLLNADGAPFRDREPKIHINENFRNTLDDYLTAGREWITDYRTAKEISRRLSDWVKQLRRFTCLALFITSVSALLALCSGADGIQIADEIHLALLVASLGVAFGWGYYAMRVFLESNPLSDLETKHAGI